MAAAGDDAALAALLERARDDADMLPSLTARLAQRAPLFAPHRERTALQDLVGGLLTLRRHEHTP